MKKVPSPLTRRSTSSSSTGRCRWKSIPTMRISPCAPWACPAWARWASRSAIPSPWIAPPAAARRLSLGLHAVARNEPRVHAHDDRIPSAALVHGRHRGARRDRRQSPEWGDRLGPDEITAIKEHKLLPIADLDRGFIHPSFPRQIMVSYFQGGKICDYITDKWGWDTILAMLHDYAQRRRYPLGDPQRTEASSPMNSTSNSSPMSRPRLKTP